MSTILTNLGLLDELDDDDEGELRDEDYEGAVKKPNKQLDSLEEKIFLLEIDLKRGRLCLLL